MRNNDANAICQIQGHEMNKIEYICTYKKCQQDQRLICEECFAKQFHSHGSLMKLDDFMTHLNLYIQPKIDHQKGESKRISKFIKEFQLIIEKLQLIVEQYELFKQHSKNIEKAFKQANKNIYKINFEELNNLINIDQGNIDYFQIQNKVQKIIVQLQDLNKEFVSISFVPFSDIKIENISSPNISQNESSLSCIIWKNISVINMNNNKIKTNKQLKNQINIVRFSQNSQFIFVGDIVGNFKYISNKSSFKQICSKRIHITGISDILQISDNHFIISSLNICLIDLIKRRQLLKIINSSHTYCLEFDRINNLIIGVFEEKVIKFFDRNNGNVAISKSFGNQKKIHQVQLINKSQNLLGCDKYSLKLWQIDHQKKKLILIKELNLDVHYFKSVYQDQRIIMRNKNKLIITDVDFNTIYETSIKGQNFDVDNKFDQLESMNYIIIQDKSGSLKILKSINKEN